MPLPPVLLAGNMNVVFAAADVFERQLERLDDAVLQFFVHPMRADAPADVVATP